MQIEANWLHSTASVAIFDAFTAAGKQAYFVGGCVRNCLLGLSVADLDIATDATPDETIEIARRAGLRAILTGYEHGTITVISAGIPYEITTFRCDLETDGRHAVVAFSTNISDDARRRDFTMNALYADKTGLILDPLAGLPDLRARRVRFIENADQRITEDYLRILRFFRFHAWYGDPAGGIDAEGLAACAHGANGIETLSKERIGSEMCKLLAAPDPAQALAAMESCGALMRILPGADSRSLAPLIHLEIEVGVSPAWQRRLAVIGGESPKVNLRLANTDTKRLKYILQVISSNYSPAVSGYRYGVDVATDAVLVMAASLTNPLAPDVIAEINRGALAIFPVSAQDLQPVFVGKALGDKLRQLEQNWLDSEMQATRAELLD